MSSCMSAYTSLDELVVAVDSRMSIKIDGIKYVLGNCNKAIIAHNKLIFMCGLFSLCNSIVTSFMNQNDGSIEMLRSIAKSNIEQYLIDNTNTNNQKSMLCNLIAFTFEPNLKKPVVYNLHSEDGFEIRRYDYYTYWVHGARCDEVEKYIKDNLSRPLPQVIYDAFCHVSDEEIGGYMLVYSVDKNGISYIGKKAIIDKCPLPNVVITANWGQITNQPVIPTKASQIGALPIESSRLTYIDANGIYTGTVSADKIIGNELTAINDLRIGSANDSNMEKSLYFNDSVNFTTYQTWLGEQFGLSLSCQSLNLDGCSEITGKWDFSNADVILPESAVVARFA